MEQNGAKGESGINMLKTDNPFGQPQNAAMQSGPTVYPGNHKTPQRNQGRRSIRATTKRRNAIKAASPRSRRR